MLIHAPNQKDSHSVALVFVYNADSGLFNALTDSVHKVVSPATYSCNLCKLTYGIVGMRDKWKSFLESLKIPVKFLHRDQLHAMSEKSSKEELPAVFIQNDSELQLAISAQQISSRETIDELIALVQDVIDRHHSGYH